MKKTSLKMLALFAAILMLAAFIPFEAFAAVTGNYTVKFNGPWTVGGVQVTADKSGDSVNLNANDEITLTNFNPDTMIAKLEGENNFNCNLIVDGNGKTKLSTATADNLPATGLLEFKVVAKAGNNTQTNGGKLDIKFDGTVGGKIWYKFSTEASETEVVGNRSNITIPDGATKVTFKAENKTIQFAGLYKNGTNNSINIDDLKSNSGVTFDITSTDNLEFRIQYADTTTGGGNQGQGQGQQQQQQPQQGSGGPDDIIFDVEISDTNILMNINDKLFIDDQDGNLKNTFKGKVTGAGYKDPNHKNRIWIMNVYGDSPVIQISVNGVIYKKGESGVTIGPDGEFIVEVPGAEEYIIRGKGDPDFVKPRTIIWTNPNYVPKDDADAQWIQEFKLEHGYGYVTAVYDGKGNLLNPDTYKSKDWVVNENGGGVGKDGFGWISIYPGYKVVFEFVPEYGFQLTDIRINGQKLGVSGLMNTFEFTMPNTNIHFDAVFTATEDVVKAGSDKVAGGTVELGGALPGGSAQLTVNDVELSSDKIQGFSNAANGYTVSNYLNISLYNVYYKGKADSEDVWSKEIDELDEYVTISIQLEEGINAEDIVIVHNIHDGKDYEVIEIESYDPETRILTFKTKSFSNYAIATKGEKTITPKTGDNIGVFFTIFAVAALGTVTVIVVNRKNKRV